MDPLPLTIDLNCDLGELDDASLEAGLMEHITSANIACGGHAGDEAAMEHTIRLALDRGVRIGAHPGYPDRANFGRIEIAMSEDEIERTVLWQIGRLEAVAGPLGAHIVHLKPHGALYNQAARDPELARAVAVGIRRGAPGAIFVGLASSSAMRRAAEAEGLRFAAEAFADRAYEADGSLRSRRLGGAVLSDPLAAARQAVRLARDGFVTAWDGSEVPLRADTVCVHSDTPGAIAIARAVRLALEAEGIRVRPLPR